MDKVDGNDKSSYKRIKVKTGKFKINLIYSIIKVFLAAKGKKISYTKINLQKFFSEEMMKIL